VVRHDGLLLVCITGYDFAERRRQVTHRVHVSYDG
jgi:hypothetical protein